MKWLSLAILFTALAAGAGWLVLTSAEPTADLRFITASEVNTLDPQRMSWLHDIRIAECLFEPLLRVNLQTMAPEPATAQDYTRSSDGLTYTFHLRPTARWSNGDPVTAPDFIYAWRRALCPDSASDYSNLFFNIRGAFDPDDVEPKKQEARKARGEPAKGFFTWRAEQLEAYARLPKEQHTAETAAAYWREAEERFTKTVGLSAPDERTLVVQLRQPMAYFPEVCAFATSMPVHARSVETWVSLDAESGRRSQDPRWTAAKHLICNGPYVLKHWRFKRDLLVVANDYYWNRAAMNNKSVLQLYVENQTLMLMFYERGEVDWLPDVSTTSALAADVLAQKPRETHVVPAAGTYYYIANCQKTLSDGKTPNPVADPRVRRALSLAIDRQTIVDKITRLHQPVARAFTPPGAIPGYNPPEEAGIGYDPAAARTLLAEAGYATKGHPGGKPLAGLSILTNTEGGHQVIAQFIRRAWEEELGVSVGLESVETRIFRERRKTKDFTIARGGWYGDYRDPTTFLDLCRTSNEGNNDGAWSNARFDQLMEQSDVEPDPQKRFALMREAEALMLQEQPVMPIYQYVNLHLYDPNKVEGLTLNAWNFRRLEFVKVRKP